MPQFLELSALTQDNKCYKFILNKKEIIDAYPYNINEHLSYTWPNCQHWPVFWVQSPNIEYKTQITLKNGTRHCCLEDVNAILNQIGGIIRTAGKSI